MVDTTLPGVFLKGVAASRPAANAVAAGTVYSATDTGAITQSDGVSTWSTWATISSGMADPMTTRGDMIIRNAANATARLGRGSAATVLTSDGTDIAWAAPGASGIPATIVDVKGDLIAATAADTVARLAAGANDLMLLAASGETTGLKWGHPVNSVVSADCTADEVLVADVIEDAPGCSVSLVAGTWVILGQMIFLNSTASGAYTAFSITDSANTKVGETRGTAVSASLPEGSFCVAVVTPGSTTTYKLRGQMGGGGTMTIVRYAESTEIGTRIVAVRIA